MKSSSLSQGDLDKLLSKLWRATRCGMYHAGMTREGVYLSGEPSDAVSFHLASGTVIINPHILVRTIRGHFERMIGDLKVGKDATLQRSFLKWFAG